MKTKSTLEKALKFVSDCKIIFWKRKNIFQKNIFLLLCLLTTTFSFSQSENVDLYLASLESSGQTAKLNELKHLLYDLHSAVYSSASGEINVYGEQPTALYTSIRSINSLNATVSDKSDIEIATIKIQNSSELNQSIDLTAFSGFEKLKYIFIISEAATSQNVINNLIKNDNSKYVLIYKISIGG